MLHSTCISHLSTNLFFTQCCLFQEFISRGVYKAYSEGYLRYSQERALRRPVCDAMRRDVVCLSWRPCRLEVAPLSMFEEANTKTNLPAQIDMLSQSDNLDLPSSLGTQQR